MSYQKDIDRRILKGFGVEETDLQKSRTVGARDKKKRNRIHFSIIDKKTGEHLMSTGGHGHEFTGDGKEDAERHAISKFNEHQSAWGKKDFFDKKKHKIEHKTFSI